MDFDNYIIMAGAGMGVESGFSTYRDKKGFFTEYPMLKDKGLDYETIASPDGYYKNLQEGWDFYRQRAKLYASTDPHTGYHELLEMVKDKNHFVVTTNVDSHFEKTGFNKDKIWEVHGSVSNIQCGNYCNRSITPFVDSEKVPFCHNGCQWPLRPNVVMFDDYTYDHSINKEQEDRYRGFADALYGSKTLIILIGAGTRIPTLRIMSNSLYRYRNDIEMCMINPNDCYTKIGGVSLVKSGATDGIRKLAGYATYEEFLKDEVVNIS